MIILVGNLKGGSGKSFIATGLALAYADMKQKVAIIDLDTATSASTRLLVGIDTVENNDTVLAGPFTVKNGLITVYSAPMSPDWDVKMFSKPQLLALELAAIAQEDYDVLIVDTPSAAYPATATALKTYGRRAMFLTPVSRAPWSLVGAYAFAKLAQKLNTVPRSHVIVVNNVYERELKKVAANIARLLGVLPWHARVYYYVPRRVKLEDETESTYAVERFETVLKREKTVYEKLVKLAKELEEVKE